MVWRRLVRYLKGRVITVIWRLRGVTVPDRVVVEGLTPSLGNDGTIKLGSRVSMRGYRVRSRLGAWKGATLEIGDRTFINSGVVIESTTAITIGNNCLIGDQVIIHDSNYHELEQGAGVKQRPIRIGNNVWICARAMILPGVEIGDHSVIGAGSVVSRSVPARVLAAGNPATVIREVAAADGYIRR